MTAKTHYIRLPRRFVEDRIERGLDCGETTIKPPHQVLCVCSTDALTDMADDAQYQGWETDMEHRAIPESAKRACRAICAYMDDQGIARPSSCRSVR